MTLVFATHNEHKAKEIAQLLPAGYDLQTLKDHGFNEEIEENSSTIEGNASIKSQYLWDRLGKPCFADDTGLMIDALGGEPGVFSARYAGPEKSAEDNMELVLRKMKGETNRKAFFKTVISYFDARGIEHRFEGVINGTILEDRSGTEGFGYDPIFLPDGYAQTFAEMRMQTKNEISHRALAFKKFIKFLEGEG